MLNMSFKQNDEASIPWTFQQIYEMIFPTDITKIVLQHLNYHVNYYVHIWRTRCHIIKVLTLEKPAEIS